MTFEDLPENPPQIMDMEFSMSQRFELERMLRAIDSCNNLAEIKSLTKKLAQGWMTQKAAVTWLIMNNKPTRIG